MVNVLADWGGGALLETGGCPPFVVMNMDGWGGPQLYALVEDQACRWDPSQMVATVKNWWSGKLHAMDIPLSKLLMRG